MPPKRTPTAAKKPVPKRRSPKRRSRFGFFALVIAIPVLALIGFFGYEFFAAGASETEPVAGEKPVIQERVPVAQLLSAAGIERGRVHSAEGQVTVESFSSVEEIARRIRRADREAKVVLAGSSIVITRGGHNDTVNVLQLHKSKAGEGFEPAQADEAVREADESLATAHYAGQPRIALIIDDVGFERQPIREASSLPTPLNFAIIPGTPRATESANFLSEHGFQILCHLPMEPLDSSLSGGPLTIMTSMESSEIRRLARENIRSIPHVVGVNNHMGSKATRDARVMQDVVDVLREEGLYFVDSRTGPGSVGARTARHSGVPTASRDVFLDDVERASAVRKQFGELVAIAKRRGTAIGIGHMYPVTISVLSEELPKLKDEGITLVPVSEIVR